MARIYCFNLLSILAMSLVWVAGSAFAQQQLQQITLENKLSIEGRVQEIGIDFVVFNVDGDLQRISFEKIDSIQFDHLVKDSDSVADRLVSELVDGSKLMLSSLEFQGDLVEGVLVGGTAIKMSRKSVAVIRRVDYQDELELAKQFREIRNESFDGDALVVNRNKSLNAIEGIVKGIVDGKIEFAIDDRSAKVPFDRVDNILFYQSKGRELARPVAEVGLRNGSSIFARRLEWSEGKLIVSGCSGSDFQIDSNQIVRVSFSLGRNVFLSNLRPTTNDWEPLIASASLVERLRSLKLARLNESFTASPLSLRVFDEQNLSGPGRIQQFEHGVAIQGGGKIAFSLNGQYSRLTGLAGFSPEASLGGKVTLKIVADGKTAFEKTLVHRTMRGPERIDLDVEGVERIVLIVGYNDGRSTGDRIHLADLKLIQ